jgi:predicted DNA-binding transcriptional regulator AlpA
MSVAISPASPDVPASRPLLVRQPWLVVGLSKSAWYRLASADRTPKPVRLPGSRPLYRLSDLQDWVTSLRASK